MWCISCKILLINFLYHNKENLERYEPNKNGRGDRAALTKDRRLASSGPQVSIVRCKNETKKRYIIMKLSNKNTVFSVCSRIGDRQETVSAIRGEGGSGGLADV